jgi:hypothetical protein
MRNKEGKVQMFKSIRLDIPCLLFFKTQLPVDPTEFVHRICEEIVAKPGIRRMRYINRLTPISCIGKATEKGLEEVGKAVLGKHFQLAGPETQGQDEKPGCSVSIHVLTTHSFCYFPPLIGLSLFHNPPPALRYCTECRVCSTLETVKRG